MPATDGLLGSIIVVNGKSFLNGLYVDPFTVFDTSRSPSGFVLVPFGPRTVTPSIKSFMLYSIQHPPDIE